MAENPLDVLLTSTRLIAAADGTEQDKSFCVEMAAIALKRVSEIAVEDYPIISSAECTISNMVLSADVTESHKMNDTTYYDCHFKPLKRFTEISEIRELLPENCQHVTRKTVKRNEDGSIKFFTLTWIDKQTIERIFSSFAGTPDRPLPVGATEPIITAPLPEAAPLEPKKAVDVVDEPAKKNSATDASDIAPGDSASAGNANKNRVKRWLKRYGPKSKQEQPT